MKLEQLIVQYLYTSKKVTIQDIGSFSISPDVVLPSENDKDLALPPGAIAFEFDQRATQDEDLISFIMQQTHKIRPLAASDLESYSNLSKQFLNLGKPLIIEGLGALQKNQFGTYEFTQGQLANARLETPPARMKEKLSDDISFRSENNGTFSRNKSKRAWFGVLALFFVALAGAGIYFLLHKNNKKTQEVVTAATDTVAAKPATVLVTDTTIKSQPVTDTNRIIAPTTDSTTFKVMMKYRSKEVAEKAQTYLRGFGHNLSIAPLDSVRYKLTMPFKMPLSDTTRAKDSVSKMFGAKTFIELP